MLLIWKLETNQQLYINN